MEHLYDKTIGTKSAFQEYFTYHNHFFLEDIDDLHNCFTIMIYYDGLINICVWGDKESYTKKIKM